MREVLAILDTQVTDKESMTQLRAFAATAEECCAELRAKLQVAEEFAGLLRTHLDEAVELRGEPVETLITDPNTVTNPTVPLG